MASFKGDHVSLFTGLGMLDYAAEQAGWCTIATAESNPFCRSVLRARFPGAVHKADVLDVTYFGNCGSLGTEWFERPLLVSGGFPCQDINGSGTGLGLSGARSGLVREQLRVIREFMPEYALFENSSMLVGRGLYYILDALTRTGYHVRWECLTAATLDAPHLRDRCWIMARAKPWDVEVDDCLGHYGAYGAYAAEPSNKLPRSGVASPKGAVYSTVPLDTVRAGRRNATAIHGRLLPTPTKSDGSGGPGTTPKRMGGKNLRTVAHELTGNGRLNPAYVEWMMGLPIGWSDPSNGERWDDFRVPMSWRMSAEPPMTVPLGFPHRGKRIQALGNGLVPVVASVALDLLVS